MNPEKILQTGMAFWASKALMSALEIGVFTELARGPQSLDALHEGLGLHPRSARDFLDALVVLGFLKRKADLYSNSPETDVFLDSGKPSFMGGILELANSRLYPFRRNLTEGLRTGRPQNELRSDGPALFETLYSDPARLKEFLGAMSGISRGANTPIPECSHGTISAHLLMSAPLRAIWRSRLLSPTPIWRASALTCRRWRRFFRTTFHLMACRLDSGLSLVIFSTRVTQS